MTRVAFLVNGGHDSPMGHRARAFAGHLDGAFDIHVAYRAPRRLQATGAFVSWLRSIRPQVTYVFDMAAPGVLAGALHRATTGTPLIVETGDAIGALARSMGTRGMTGIVLTEALETLSLAAADRIVVRGTRHADVLAARGIQAEIVQDGVDVSAFRARAEPALRTELGLDDVLSVGVIGSTVWNPRLGLCYGWDLVEALRLLPEAPVVGVMIGDGSGLPHLRAQCEAHGLQHRMRFLGRVPYEELPRYLSVMDVCLSTQTNDVVGAVRTTGKLPLYMASGRYILASRVGEAALVLPDEMLVPYDGVLDHAYPERLAERLAELADDPTGLAAGRHLAEAAERVFDYRVLAPRVAALLERTAGS